MRPVLRWSLAWGAVALAVVAVAQEVGPPAPEPAPPVEVVEPVTEGLPLASPPPDPPPVEAIEADLDDTREDLGAVEDKLDRLIEILEERAEAVEESEPAP